VNGGSQIDCIPNAEEKYISFSKSIYDDGNGNGNGLLFFLMKRNSSIKFG